MIEEGVKPLKRKETIYYYKMESPSLCIFPSKHQEMTFTEHFLCTRNWQHRVRVLPHIITYIFHNYSVRYSNPHFMEKDTGT